MNEDPLHLSLAITAYLLSLAVFIPLSGWVADRYGARRVFRAAILVFTLGSALCGISQRSEEHTSELQSLMRISYAVFCLRKNKRAKIRLTTINESPLYKLIMQIVTQHHTII